VDESGQLALLATAAVVGLVHTITGPDHYLPFVAMSRAGNWSMRKSLTVTACCGAGHVASSIALGFAGLVLGTAVSGLVTVEEFRGNVAGWLLFGFGLAYLLWGLRLAWNNRPHEHVRVHVDETICSHPHTHDHNYAPVHANDGARVVTPWVLFLIFAFGPCEPLIPLLMYPAASIGLGNSLLAAAVFGSATIGTMLLVVMLGCAGVSQLSNPTLTRYSQAICGAAVAACGAAVCFGL
jgi:nickel/cobalt transporter (NicO) family protein